MDHRIDGLRRGRGRELRGHSGWRRRQVQLPGQRGQQVFERVLAPVAAELARYREAREQYALAAGEQGLL